MEQVHSRSKPLSLAAIAIPPTNAQPPTGLIVVLHGWGANAEDLASLARFVNLPDWQFLCPDAPFPHPRLPGGRAWYDLETREYKGLEESREMLRDWLKSLESSTGIPLSRTILAGFSQGGAMTLDVGLTLPLAGLISLSGYLHAQPQPESDTLPPILIVHGQQDYVVPLRAAHQARSALEALGASVQYREFDMGHEIIPAVIALMRSFVVEAMSKAR